MWPKQWQRRADSTTNPLTQSRASPMQSAHTPKSNSVPRTCICGWRSCAVWRRRGGTRTRCGVEVVLGEQRGTVQLAAHVRHCRAFPCKKIEGKEGWTHIVFCLDPVTLSLEGALEAALQLQKEVRKHDPAPREASRLLTQMREKQSVWRTEWNNTVYTWLSSCVVGYWSLRWYKFF